MNANVTEEVVAQINAYLQQQPWLDFEVVEYRGNKLVVIGSLDTSAPHDVEVWFAGVFFVSLPMEWKTDTSVPPLSLLTGEHARQVNRRFQVEEGHHIFRFTPEDHPADFGCLIGARSVGFSVTK